MDIEKYKEMTLDDLKNVLDKTIKHDDINKIITFLGMLLAYTKDSQFNIIFNSPSSTGKTYIALETSKFFPKESVLDYAYASPKSFYHKTPDTVDKDSGEHIVDLSRKILIFMDQPHHELLSNLRPILSHDKEMVKIDVAENKRKDGHKTKTILIKGFPTVIYCSARLRIDEQEMTRCFLLSPEVTQDKFKDGINHAIKNEALGSHIKNELLDDHEYQNLKNRIIDIKNLEIENIEIKDWEKIRDKFIEKEIFESKDMRNVKRLVSLIKSMALLNFWFRDKSEDGKVIYANDDDIQAGFKIWSFVSENQDRGISPYALEIFEKVIYSFWDYQPLTRKQIINKYFKVFNSHLSPDTLRLDILPILINAGLIYEEQDPKDNRIQLIHVSDHVLNSRNQEFRKKISSENHL